MPVQRCQKDGQDGWKWGPNGVCFVGRGARARAAAVGRAIHAREGEGKESQMDLEAKIADLSDEDLANLSEADVDALLAAEAEDSEPEGEESKVHMGGLVEFKEATRNGQPVGLVQGYLSTWEADTGGVYGKPDQFVPGAWLDSIAEHKARGNRQVRLKDMHGKTIGGFPIDTVREDARGLFGIGEVNLVTQQGREAFSLVQQGVITDFSVGYTAVEDDRSGDVRLIKRAVLWESSLVDEPGNRGANITGFKGARVTAIEAKKIGRRELERVLRESGKFTKSAARLVALRFSPPGGASPRYDARQLEAILADLRGAKDDLARG